MTLADLIRTRRVNLSIHPRLRSNTHALWDGSRAWVSREVAAELDRILAEGQGPDALTLRAELLEIVELWPESHDPAGTTFDVRGM